METVAARVPGPCAAEAEAAPHACGVPVPPRLVADAGGAIRAAVGYHGGKEEDAIRTIASRIRAGAAAVPERAARAAFDSTCRRVCAAMTPRRSA